MSPFYDYAEGYVIRALIGGEVQIFNHIRQRIPFQYDFFGISSTEAIEWVEFRHKTGFMTLDNFWYFGIPVSFSSFDPALTIITIPTGLKFHFVGSLILGPGAKAFNPATDGVSIQLGSVIVRIPAGKFQPNSTGGFVFNGVVGGINLGVTIQPQSAVKLKVIVNGKGANFTGIINPVPVTLAVGYNTGTKSVIATFSGKH